ncbi:MAG: diacylglycerol kinase family protein [Thermoanaerobaculia bacterium]
MSSGANDRYLLIINPVAGKGRCGKRAPAALERLRAAGLDVETRWTREPRDAVAIARQGFEEGYRNFISAGGDGTDFEVVNGILPPSLESGEKVRLGILPLGTGTSFLRDHATDLEEHGIRSLIDKRRQPCDVLVLSYSSAENGSGRYYFINIFGFGSTVDASIRGLKYKRLGALGYVLGGVESILFMTYPKLPMRVDGGELEDRPATLTSVLNNRYTAQLKMAPDADIADGRFDLIRAEPMSRLEMIRTFPKLLAGTHVEHPLISAVQAREIRFEVDEEVDVMIDGEILRLKPESIEILPRAIEVCV